MGLLLLLTLGTAHAAAPNGPPVGGQAPAFILPDVQGKPFRLEDHKGQTLVLNFWAFWCDTWKAELPSLTELSDRQEELGFRLVAVSVDGTRLSEFARRTGGTVPFPVLLDGGGRVSARYRVHHVPTVVILGPDGVVRFTTYGYPGNSVVLRELRKIALGGKKPPDVVNAKTAIEPANHLILLPLNFSCCTYLCVSKSKRSCWLYPSLHHFGRNNSTGNKKPAAIKTAGFSRKSSRQS